MVSVGRPLVLGATLSLIASGIVYARSEVSTNGGGFAEMSPFVTVVQRGSSNAVAIVEDGSDGAIVDSAVAQTGFYNRTAIVQMGNDKQAAVYQTGRYNRALIVQIPSSTQDAQTSILDQAGTGSINYGLVKQLGVGDPDPVAVEFGALSFAGAKQVARNFLYAPELSRVHVWMLQDISEHFVGLLTNRLDQGRRSLCVDRERVAVADGSVGGGADCSASPFFAFVSYGQTDRDDALGVLGYQQSIRSITLGADLWATDALRLGIALNAADSDSDIDNGLGRVDTSGFQIGAFGSLDLSRFYLDLLAAVSQIDFSSDRFAGPMKVSSDTDGLNYAARMQAGYHFGDDAMRIGPFVAVGYSNGEVDGYSEDGSILVRQTIEDQELERLVASIGAAMHRSDSIGNGLLHSHLKVEIERDFGIGGEDEFKSWFALSPSSAVFTPLDDVKEDTYGKVTAGMTFAVNDQAQLSLLGTTLIGADRVDTYGVYGGLSIRF